MGAADATLLLLLLLLAFSCHIRLPRLPSRSYRCVCCCMHVRLSVDLAEAHWPHGRAVPLAPWARCATGPMGALSGPLAPWARCATGSTVAMCHWPPCARCTHAPTRTLVHLCHAPCTQLQRNVGSTLAMLLHELLSPRRLSIERHSLYGAQHRFMRRAHRSCFEFGIFFRMLDGLLLDILTCSMAYRIGWMGTNVRFV